jgi:hypothetical protein
MWMKITQIIVIKLFIFSSSVFMKCPLVSKRDSVRINDLITIRKVLKVES